MITTANVRGEHVLWLTPMVYAWLASYTAPVQMIMFFLNNTYYLLSFVTCTMVFLLLIAGPYLLHKHLRETKTRSIVIAWMHILSSFLLMVTILMIYTYTPPISREWRYYPIVQPSFERWRNMNSIAIVLFQLFLLIQVIYSVYGLSKIFHQKRVVRNKQVELSYSY
jgi:hypothetical protein